MADDTNGSQSAERTEESNKPKLPPHDVSDNFIDFVEKAGFLIGIPCGFQFGAAPEGRHGNLWLPPACWGAPTIASVWTSLEPTYDQQRWMTSAQIPKDFDANSIATSEHRRQLSTQFFYRYGIATNSVEHEDPLEGDSEGFAIHAILYAHTTRIIDSKNHWIRVDAYEALSSRADEAETDPTDHDLVMIEVSFMRPKAANATSILILGDAMLFSSRGMPAGAELTARADSAPSKYDWTKKQYVSNLKSSVRGHIEDFFYGIRDQERGKRVFTKKEVRTFLRT
jgi:hypothetical protein